MYNTVKGFNNLTLTNYFFFVMGVGSLGPKHRYLAVYCTILYNVCLLLKEKITVHYLVLEILCCW